MSELAIGKYYKSSCGSDTVKLVGSFNEQFGQLFYVYQKAEAAYSNVLGYFYPKIMEDDVFINAFSDGPYEKKDILEAFKAKAHNKITQDNNGE